MILATIAGPSFALLYALDDVSTPVVTLKVTGNQWYWSYEYPKILNSIGLKDLDAPLQFESYMIRDEDLNIGQIRLLETDNIVCLPVRSHIRILVTSSDVLHSWAIPSLGVKIDACPGRLNEVSTYIKREGYYYGQCSEICGVLHGFMPIGIHAVELNDFIDWVLFYINNIDLEDLSID